MEITKGKNSITFTLTDTELSVLADNLIDPPSWFETMGKEKLDNCKSAMIKTWLPTLVKNGDIVGKTTDDVLIEKIISRADYKDRKSRESIEKY